MALSYDDDVVLAFTIVSRNDTVLMKDHVPSFMVKIVLI